MANVLPLRFPRSVEGWLGWVIVLMLAFFSLMSNEFLSIQNLLDLTESYAVTGIFALGLFVVLVTGGIDISFAAVASVVQYVVASLLLSGTMTSPLLCVGFAIALGVIFGLINAILIYYLNVVSIIITISMQSLLFGLLMWLTNGHSIYDLPDWWITQRSLFSFGFEGETYQVGLPLVVMLAMACFTWMLMNKTHIGRQLYAVGGSTESARRIGIRVSLIYLFAYGYLGAAAAIGGMLQAYRMSEVVPNALVGGELDVLAAAVLGGASLSGGRGSVIGTLMGVFLIGILKNGLNLIGVSSYFVNIVIGVVIVSAICVTHYKKRKETDVGFV